jgi:hypothetical protein
MLINDHDLSTVIICMSPGSPEVQEVQEVRPPPHPPVGTDMELVAPLERLQSPSASALGRVPAAGCPLGRAVGVMASAVGGMPFGRGVVAVGVREFKGPEARVVRGLE